MPWTSGVRQNAAKLLLVLSTAQKEQHVFLCLSQSRLRLRRDKCDRLHQLHLHSSRQDGAHCIVISAESHFLEPEYHVQHLRREDRLFVHYGQHWFQLLFRLHFLCSRQNDPHTLGIALSEWYNDPASHRDLPGGHIGKQTVKRIRRSTDGNAYAPDVRQFLCFHSALVRQFFVVHDAVLSGSQFPDRSLYRLFFQGLAFLVEFIGNLTARFATPITRE